MEQETDERVIDAQYADDNAAELPRGLAITDDDVNIFRLIYEYRFLRREHLSLLCGRSMKRLHRRLHRLVEGCYLTVIRLPQQRHIYGLAKPAVSVLVSRGIGDEALLTQRIRTHELKPLFIEHEMMVVDIHVMLALASAASPLKLVTWREGKGLYESVPMAGQDPLPFRPDALFVLEDTRRLAGANRVQFFLEADRSSENQRQFRGKIIAYFHYAERGMHATKYNIKGFRVVTVALTDDRAKNLCDLARATIPERGRKLFLFASLGRFSLTDPAAMFSEVYRSPRFEGGDNRISLIPAPASLPSSSEP